MNQRGLGRAFFMSAIEQIIYSCSIIPDCA